MKRETLFEEIGKLDAAVLDENVAQAPRKRRPLLWGTFAACFVLCVGAICLHRSQQTDMPTASTPETTQQTVFPTETTTTTEPTAQLTMPDISETPILLATPAYVPSLLRFTQPMQERLAQALQAGTWEALPDDTISADGECQILFVNQPDAPFRLIFYPDCTVEHETADGTKKYRISEETYTAILAAMQPEDPLPLLVTYEMEQITRTGVWEYRPDFHTASLSALEDLGEGMHYRLIRDTCQASEYQNLPEEELPLMTIRQVPGKAPNDASLAFPTEGTALSGSWTTAENGNPQFSLDGGGYLQFQPIEAYTLQLVKMEDVPESVQALEGTSFTACVDSWQPFAEIRASDLQECTVEAGPYPQAVTMTAEERAMLTTLLQEVRIVQRDQTGIVYNGISPIFGNLTLQDGTELRIAVRGNQLFVNDRWFFVDDDGATNAVQNLLDEVYD